MYLNIVGGLKVQETAADLAVALAVVSSYTNIPVRSVREPSLDASIFTNGHQHGVRTTLL